MKASLGKAKTSIKSFSTSAIDKLGGVAKLASGALVAGFIASAKAALEYGREMKNLAELSGAGFEEFQRLTLGAKSVGVEHQKLADIFKDVNDKLGDFAQTGGGPLADFFENIGPAIGVTIKDFQDLSGPQALQLYYDSLSKVNLTQQDMTFYMEAIASDAAALMPLLADGGVAWEAYAKKMEEAGLMMSEEMSEELEKAQARLEMLSAKTTIASAEMLMAWKLFGKGFGQVIREADNILYGLKDVIAGTFTFDEKQLQAGWDRVFNTFKNGFDRIKGVIDGQLFDWGIGEVETSIIELPQLTEEMFNQSQKQGVEAAKAITEAQRKGKTEIDKLDEKISAETIKRTKLEQTAEEELAAAEKKRVDALAALQVANASGDELKAKKAQLVYAKALTEEAKARQKAKAEIEKTDATITDLLKKGSELAAKIATETAEQNKEAALVSEQVRLQAELKDAIARGDQEAVKVIQEELNIEEEIVQVIRDHNVSREQAVAHVTALRDEERKLADEKQAAAEKMLGMERDLLNAVLSGDDMAARAAQKKIDLEQRAQQIMQDLKVDYEEAYEIAKKLAAIEAGPDLDDSGFTTRFEQKKFDRQQKERQEALDKGLAAEERDQRERGGNIPNVTAERNDTGTVRERAAADKERREQRKANQRINRERDPAKRAEMIEAENVRRNQARIKEGGQKALDDWKKQGADAPKQFDLDGKPILNGDGDIPGGQPLGPDGKPVGPGGNHIGPDGKMVGPNGQPLGPNGQPLDPNGKPVPDGPKQPGGGQDPSLEKLDKIITELVAVNKSLTC